MRNSGNGFRPPLAHVALRAKFIPTTRPGSPLGPMSQPSPSSYSQGPNTSGSDVNSTSKTKLTRHYWHEAEEAALVEAMQIVMALGGKDETTKISNVNSKLEKLMKERIPNCPIGVDKIRTKLKNWKAKYCMVDSILQLSGANFVGGKNKLDVESSEAWGNYCKVCNFI